MPFTVALTPYVIHKVSQAIMGLFCSDLQTVISQLLRAPNRPRSLILATIYSVFAFRSACMWTLSLPKAQEIRMYMQKDKCKHSKANQSSHENICINMTAILYS